MALQNVLLAGLGGTGGAWGDFNNSGFPDLFVGNETGTVVWTNTPAVQEGRAFFRARE